MAKKKPYRIFIYGLLRLLAALIFVMPRSWALGLARMSGRFSYQMVARQRNLTYGNLKEAFGSEKTDKELHALGAEVFSHLAQTGVEILQFSKLTRDKVRVMVDAGEAIEVYRRLLNEGKGIISITAHLGNWELLAGIFGLEGFRGAVVARKIYYERYNRWIVGLRETLGVRTIYREQAGREVLSVLKRNEIIGMLADQDIPSQPGVFVDFFGKPAYTPVAPVRVSLATGAPIVINFLIREPGNRYRIRIADIIRPVMETRREDALQKYTEKWMREVETVIRQYPAQWAWMHNRWKTQPPAFEIKNIGALSDHD